MYAAYIMVERSCILGDRVLQQSVAAGALNVSAQVLPLAPLLERREQSIAYTWKEYIEVLSMSIGMGMVGGAGW